MHASDKTSRGAADQAPPGPAAMSLQLRAVAIGLVRRLRTAASPGELTWSQESALFRLEIAGPSTVSQLARAEGTRSQSMSAIVAALKEQGLVHRAPDTGDGRQSIVSVSDRGRRALAGARAVRQDWLADRLTRELDEHEQDIVAKALPLLLRIVEGDPG